MHPFSETAGVCWSTKRFHDIEVQGRVSIEKGMSQHREGYESAKILYAERREKYRNSSLFNNYLGNRLLRDCLTATTFTFSSLTSSFMMIEALGVQD